MTTSFTNLLFSAASLMAFATIAIAQASATPLEQSIRMLETELVTKYGDAQRTRINRGMHQVEQFWRVEDGNAKDFETFVRSSFAGTQSDLDTMFVRCGFLLEQLDGHMGEIGREFRTHTDLDCGPVTPLDDLFASYDPLAHVTDDLFANKIAFVVLLNFPFTTLDQRLHDGPAWTRRQWAETRLVQRFSRRIPASVNLAFAAASAEADRYISDYNIWMHHLLDASGTRIFPQGMRLLSHWNLRDQIKADYENTSNGIARQRLIQKVMERIVTQTIPAAVINNPSIDWNPFANTVARSNVHDTDDLSPRLPAAINAFEPDTRYAMLLKTFQAARLADPYSPTAPTHIERRFNEDRQIPEARFRDMLVAICSSPFVSRVASLITRRLGRPLEPFDIWYNGFHAKSAYTEDQLDQIVRKRYPTAEAYRNDIPNLLRKLGFSDDRATLLARNIVVDPARGSGHALGSSMRSAAVHLRTRFEKTGMNYKGFNIAVHEMGHNVEQTFSLTKIDYTLLQGVPNTAFTEALAFVFQGHDLELLGLVQQDPQADALKALNDFWATFEIAGVALVDMDVWHWMYAHPAATPAELKTATLEIARDIWNRHYAPVFGRKDVELLAIYSHMIDSFMYLPDYPLGHMIAHQVEEKMQKSGSIGPEFERMAIAGNITPDMWMMQATGAPVGPQALLEATARALDALGQK